VVTGSGNTPGLVTGWPGRFGCDDDPNYMPDLIIVGGVKSTDGQYEIQHSVGRSPGYPASLGNWADQDPMRRDVDVYTPSDSVSCPNDKGGMDAFDMVKGTFGRSGTFIGKLF
jgi:hypothetical protein